MLNRTRNGIGGYESNQGVIYVFNDDCHRSFVGLLGTTTHTILHDRSYSAWVCMLLLHKHKIINKINLNYKSAMVEVFFVEQWAWFVARRLIRKFRISRHFRIGIVQFESNIETSIPRSLQTNQQNWKHYLHYPKKSVNRNVIYISLLRNEHDNIS